VLSDLPTPTYGGPVQGLYTVEFYRGLKRRMKPGGVLVVQAGSGSLLQIGFHLKLHRTLREVFPVVRTYSVFVPSFDVPWSFILCSPSKGLDPVALSAREVESRLKKRGCGPLRFYDGQTHEGLFRIPKDLRTLLAREKGVISAKRPVRFA
jgi:spermidine synthase